ncbi:MAG: PaaI family thioesterase [Kibdelosporangium sp.]
MTDPDKWLVASPFLRDLGLRWCDGQVELTVTEPHTVTGALHGGAIASLAMTSAEATMRTADPDADPTATSIHVTYAKAARGTTFTASSTTVRRIRELGYYQTELRNADGDVIAGASSTLSCDRQGTGEAAPLPPLPGDPAEFARETAAIPFLNRRGLRVEGIDRGAVEITMDPEERNLDDQGRIHPGAVLTLIDLSGSSAPWTHPRPSTSGATIALHAQLLGRPPADTVVARATVRAHDERVFWCDITVWRQADRRLCALGHLTYRFA